MGMVEHDNGSPTWRPGRLLLFALPFVVVLLSFMVWVVALSRSGFWADDFLEVTHFFHSLGELGNDHINAGRYVDNLFWAVGTYAFGTSSVIPFLMLNTAVFAAGVIFWLWTGSNRRWSPLVGWWIGALFIATAVWYPTALSASAIGHSTGFLALGIGLYTHERSMRAGTLRHGALWSVACGAAWTLAVISNIIYIGLLPIAAYCAVHQMLKLRGFGLTTPRASVATGFWNLLLPLIYFFAVAYPATTYKPEYAKSGLRFVRGNLHFYRESLAPSTLLAAVYIVALVLAIIGGVLAARRRDWFPLAVLAAGGAVATPALVQSQQRAVFYLAMPLLLFFSALGAGTRPLLYTQRKHLVRASGALFVAAAAMLVLVFGQGTDLRAFFVQTPYGASLNTFRSQVASLTPEDGAICVLLNLSAPEQALFAAEMSSENGFVVPPISAAQAYLVPAGTRCPAQGAPSITVNADARGNFVASG